MKASHFKFRTFLLSSIILLVLSSSCEKDKLEVNEVKEYFQEGYAMENPYDGGWQLTLSPNGIADILPSGDIRYRGTYKINGSKIKVKTPQDSRTYTFEILSETEIKEKKYGTVLKLRQ